MPFQLQPYRGTFLCFNEITSSARVFREKEIYATFLYHGTAEVKKASIKES